MESKEKVKKRVQGVKARTVDEKKTTKGYLTPFDTCMKKKTSLNKQLLGTYI